MRRLPDPLTLLVAGAFFMELLDGSVIATALPAMARSLGVPAVDLNAGVSAYLIAVAVFILPSGWMAGRFGARAVLTGAIAVFTASSILCGLVPSPGAFVGARVLQGIGGAMMVPVGRLVVLRMTPKPKLMGAIALLTWPALTAPLLGPPLGGFIAETLSWRWIFFINVPIGLVGAALALKLVPPITERDARPFDWAGFCLAGAASACALYGAELLGREAGAPGRALGLFALAVTLGIAVRAHVRRARHPLVELGAFAVPTFRTIMTQGTGIRGLISAVPFLLPLMFQLALGYDPFHAGLLLLALFAGNIGAKSVASMTVRRLGFRSTLVGTGIVQALTLFACAGLGAQTPLAVVIVILVVSGASRSLAFTATGTLAFADVPATHMSAANTLYSASVQLALGLGVAAASTILRAADLVVGTGGGVPSLAAFHVTFAVFGLLVVALALSFLRLAPDAGAQIASGVNA